MNNKGIIKEYMDTEEQLLTFEELVINRLIHDGTFFTTTFKHIKKTFFSGEALPTIFECIQQTYIKTGEKVKLTDLYAILTEEVKNPDTMDEVKKSMLKIRNKVNINGKIFLDKTEQWCIEKEYQMALMKCYDLFKNDKTKLKDSLDIMMKAISIKFDEDLGINPFDLKDAEKVMNESRSINFIKSGTIFDALLGGGAEIGTLNIILASVNSGKTLDMTYLATAYVLQGYNVLYASCEMSGVKIGQRMLANGADIEMDAFKTNNNISSMLNLVKQLRDENPQNKFNILVKQFYDATVLDIEAWYLKCCAEWGIDVKNNKTILFFDYMGLLKPYSSNVSRESNLYLQVLSEECRNFLVKYGNVGWSGMQGNREVLKQIKEKKADTKVGMDNTAGSFSSNGTMDTIISQFSLPLEGNEHYLVDDIKQIYMLELIKTRNSDNLNMRVKLGVVTSKMRLVELPQDKKDIKYINNTENGENKENTNEDLNSMNFDY